jgi:hypothetical protein
MPETIINRNVFPSLLHSTTYTVADSYLMVEVEHVGEKRQLRIQVWCHKDRMRMSDISATRVDLISEELTDMFTGGDVITNKGNRWALQSNIAFTEGVYMVREVIFV